MTSEAAIEQEIRNKGLTAPRLTPVDIDALIIAEYGGRASDLFKGCPTHESLERLTIVVLVLQNGFSITGTSSCVDIANYNAEIGYRIAREKAREQIWPLAGYMLRERLAEVACQVPPS